MRTDIINKGDLEEAIRECEVGYLANLIAKQGNEYSLTIVTDEDNIKVLNNQLTKAIDNMGVLASRYDYLRGLLGDIHATSLLSNDA